MIATVVFFTERPVLESVLVHDVWLTVVCERMQEVLAWTGAWFKDVEFVGSIWCGA